MRPRLALVVLALLVLAAIPLSLTVGAASLSVHDVLGALAGEGPTWMRTVVVELRLPRVLVAALAGGALSVAGVAVQGLFRNPLADPGIVGVSGGATLGAVVALYATTTMPLVMVPASAFAGGLACTALVYRLATAHGEARTTSLLLAGVAISGLSSALASLVLSVSLADWELGRQILSWMMGGLEGRTFEHVAIVLPPALLVPLALSAFARDLDALALGEETALSIGTDVRRVRVAVITLAALATAASVSVMGTVGFLGLVAPHVARRLVGPAHRLTIPASMLLGALLLVLADTLSRAVSTRVDLRPGVLTALVGGPFFLWLLMRERALSEAPR